MHAAAAANLKFRISKVQDFENLNFHLWTSRCGVVDKSLAMYPGDPRSIPGSTSLSDETLNRCPVFWDTLNQNHYQLSLGVLPDLEHHNHRPSRLSTGYCHGTATIVRNTSISLNSLYILYIGNP